MVKYLSILFLFIGIMISCQEKEISKVGFFKGAENADIFYKIVGNSDDTLVIIHGGPGAGIYSFLPSVEILKKDFTLIFFDQRGGGKSTLPEDLTKLKPEYYVEDLESLRKFFKIEQMNIIAHSFGSILLAEYAIAYPDHLDRILYHGATGPIRSEAGKYYQEKAATAIKVTDTTLTNKSASLLRALLDGISQDPVSDCYEYEETLKQIAILRKETSNYAGTTCKMPPEAVSYYYKNTAQKAPSFYGNWDYSKRLQHISFPVLVVYGKEDSLGIPQQLSWVRSYPNAKLILVPEAGKGALSDNPDFLVSRIEDFFK